MEFLFATLLTPIINAQTPAEDRYNKAQVLTRVKVECCIGILKNRFRCLLIPLQVMGPLRSSNVISASDSLAQYRCEKQRHV